MADSIPSSLSVFIYPPSSSPIFYCILLSGIILSTHLWYPCHTSSAKVFMSFFFMIEPWVQNVTLCMQSLMQLICPPCINDFKNTLIFPFIIIECLSNTSFGIVHGSVVKSDKKCEARWGTSTVPFISKTTYVKFNLLHLCKVTIPLNLLLKLFLVTYIRSNLA